MTVEPSGQRPASPPPSNMSQGRAWRGAPAVRGTRPLVLSAALFVVSGCAGLLGGRGGAPAARDESPASRPTVRARTAPSSNAAASAVLQPAPVPLAADPPDVEPDAAPSDSAGVARLVQLARVWHTVSLHHPWVATRGVPWDSALILAAPRVRAATDTSALRSAYDRLLLPLRDSLTRVVAVSQAVTPSASVEAERTDDGVLVLRIAPNAALTAADSTLVAQTLAQLPPQTSWRVLLDLRGAGVPDAVRQATRLDAFLEQTGVVDRLTRGTVIAPVVRTRRVGAPRTAALNDETDSVQSADLAPDVWARALHDAWQQSDARSYRGSATTTHRVLVLADSGTVMPLSLLAMQDASQLSLLADGSLRDAAPVPRVRVPIGGALAVTVRTGDLVHADGTEDVIADSVLPRTLNAGTSTDVARQTALAMLRAPSRLPLADRALPQRYAMACTPVFYDTSAYPYMGARLLAGFRLWSAMQARHAHRELYDDDLDAIFERVIPKLESAKQAVEYAAAIADLAASLDDSEGRPVGASYEAMLGDAAMPFRVRGAEGRVFVTHVVRDSVTSRLGMAVGTEILSVDGYPVTAWQSEHRRLAPGSNEWTRLRTGWQLMTRGNATPVTVKVRDANNRERTLQVPRTTAYRSAWPDVERPDGAVTHTLSDGMVYVDVERLTDATVPSVLASLASARGIVLDLRGTLHVDDALLLRHLATRPAATVGRLVQRTLEAPCLAPLREAATRCADVRSATPWRRVIDTAGVFTARVVALLDERTQGAMERFALSLEQMSGATLIGGSSAGAISWTTPLALPGGLIIGITATELRRTDGSQIQRVGLTPLIDARPTARGLKAGDDEVLTRAQQWLQQQLGPARRRR